MISKIYIYKIIKKVEKTNIPTVNPHFKEINSYTFIRISHKSILNTVSLKRSWRFRPTHPSTLASLDKKWQELTKLHCLLRLVFFVDLAFKKFASGVSPRCTSRFLAWNVFLLLKRRTFWKVDPGTNLIPVLVSRPRSLTMYFLFL